MKLSKKYLLLMPVLAFLAIGLLLTRDNPQGLEQWMDLYAEQGHQNGIGAPFNGVMLVTKNDQVLLKKAYGFYDRDKHIPVAADSRFLIGSMTKQFTAMLVMQQVQAGRLALDKTLSDYLPYFEPDKGRQITLHQLLSHTSGLPHYQGLIKLGMSFNSFASKVFTPRQYAQLIGKTDLINQPGTQYHYSSQNYILLGAILEQVTGKSYAALLKEHITEPLGLDNTGFADNTFAQQQVAQGYAFEEYGFFDSLFAPDVGLYTEAVLRDQSNTYSTGGVYSTVDDLFKWSQAIDRHQILSEPLTKRMLTPNLGGYCYGWMRNQETIIRRNPKVQLYTHGGGLPGFNSNIALYDDGIKIIYLSNVVRLNAIRLTQNIHLLANGINPDDFKRDLLRPEIEDDYQTFIADGGMPAFRAYYDEISKRAGYQVLPAQMAYVEMITMFLTEQKIDEAVNMVDEMFANYTTPELRFVNQIGYLFHEQQYYAQAKTYFQRNVTNYPYAATVHDSMGDAFYGAKDYLQARDSYQRAVDIAKANDDSRLDLLNANLQLAIKQVAKYQ
ncbi:MAG: serine hydrolase [Algicola sp.]|nr:serine hydrolase [Algicola sp.]